MIAILDYDAGNLTSVELAVRHVGGECVVTRDPAQVAAAERVIFPGVGAARSCMDNLVGYGLDKALKDAVGAGKPVLAICIGMQLLFERSDENDGVDCLGLLKGNVVRFDFPSERHVKVPQMGWNEILRRCPHPLLKDLKPGDECYFVHSYYCAAADSGEVFCETDYEGSVFTSAAGRGNLFGTQFHPEKSGPVGLSIHRNFLDWDGAVAVSEGAPSC